MVGLRKGFIGILNKKATVQMCEKMIWKSSIVLSTNLCSNLCSKSIRLQNVINVVVKIINFIRSRGLNQRQFEVFLDVLSAEYEDVTYHCEVRLLSREKMLKRFYKLLKEIIDFMEIKE